MNSEATKCRKVNKKWPSMKLGHFDISGVGALAVVRLLLLASATLVSTSRHNVLLYYLH